MRFSIRKIIPFVVAATVGLGFSGSFDQSSIGGPPLAYAQKIGGAPQATIDHGYVYVYRGLMNIWSRGMDQVAKELEARGVRVHLDNHRHWKELAEDAAKKYAADKSFGPIIIIGHSLGATAAVLMADKLGQYHVPVRLIVGFDGLANTEGTTASISWNVQQVVNFYNSKVLGIEMVPGRGFAGTIDNVDMQGVKGAGHLKIDKNPELQARAIALVMQALGQTEAQSATN